MIRLYEAKDYDEIEYWWQAHGGHLDPVVIPKMGYVSEIEGVMSASIFIHENESGLIWMAFPSANPSVRRKKRNEALDEIILACKGYARLRKKAIVSFIHQSPIIDRMKLHGFFVGDPKPVNLLWQP